MSMVLRAQNPPLNLVLIGKTGVGKSSTGNTLLQTDFFETAAGGLSSTKVCQLLRKSVWGRNLSVVDTPGTMDVIDPRAVLKELQNVMNFCPEGIDAFLLAFRCDVRATKEELKAAEEALSMFGDECHKRAIMVFTRAEEFDNDVRKFQKNLEAMLTAIPALRALMSKLNNRWVLMENGRKSDKSVQEKQVRGLLSIVDQVALSNPRRYNSGDQQLALANKQRMEAKEKEFDRELKAFNMREQRQEQRHAEEMKVLRDFAALKLHAMENSVQLERERAAQREKDLLDIVKQQQLKKDDDDSCTLL